VKAAKTKRTGGAQTALASVLPFARRTLPVSVRRVGLPYAELVAATTEALEVLDAEDTKRAPLARERMVNAQKLFLRTVVGGLYGEDGGYLNPLLMLRLALIECERTEHADRHLSRLIDRPARPAEIVDLRTVRVGLRIARKASS
jgi:hypothetical protein